MNLLNVVHKEIHNKNNYTNSLVKTSKKSVNQLGCIPFRWRVFLTKSSATLKVFSSYSLKTQLPDAGILLLEIPQWEKERKQHPTRRIKYDFFADRTKMLVFERLNAGISLIDPYPNPRDPGSSPENGFMEPKWPCAFRFGDWTSWSFENVTVDAYRERKLFPKRISQRFKVYGLHICHLKKWRLMARV